MDVPTKKRAYKGKRRPPAKKRDTPARPRVIDLHDYSSVGRPTKYVPVFGRVAETMAAAGATDAKIAQACGVTVRTLYRWKAEIPSFRHAIGAAKQIPIVRVERSLYHRAVGYEHDHYKILSNGGKVTIVKTVKRYPPDTSAARLWLQSVDPLHWRPRRNPEPPKPTEPATDVEEIADEEIDRSGLTKFRPLRLPAGRRLAPGGLQGTGGFQAPLAGVSGICMIVSKLAAALEHTEPSRAQVTKVQRLCSSFSGMTASSPL